MAARERLRLSAQRVGLIFSHPFRMLRRRFELWLATRTPRVPGPWVVNRRRVYILPTRYGYGYALLVLVMLLGAMNYSNSMAFALSFLLAGLGLIAMHHTHGNLVNVALDQTRTTPVFAGDNARFGVEVSNPTRAARYALSASWRREAVLDTRDVPHSGHTRLELPLPAPRRGWLPAPRFAVFTEFPLGLFHAWTWVELDMACLVYPKPAPRGEQAPPSAGGSGQRVSRQRGQEDFAGLRGYQRGDAMRAIHWKSLPKHRLPMVKQFAGTVERELWLDWDALPPNWDVERRLSQLARWVLDADAAGQAYGLRLPGQVRAPAQGELHRHECLKALALLELPA
jgi:uncharacterized protein (DUF58 family)